MKSQLALVAAFFVLVGVFAGCNGCVLFVPEGEASYEISAP